MTRTAHETVTLSDGTVIPKGTRLKVPTLHMSDAKYYPDPEHFDGKRFLRMRQNNGEENHHQFVTTSVEHLGFGHGMHACPGRFFASNELKLMLAHLLMKYDWKFGPEGRPRTIQYGTEIMLDDNANILYRSRESEVAF